METLDHSILVSGSISFTYHLIPRGKNHLNIAHIAFADGGNLTRAACAASKCAIHYSIASRLSHRSCLKRTYIESLLIVKGSLGPTKGHGQQEA